MVVISVLTSRGVDDESGVIPYESPSKWKGTGEVNDILPQVFPQVCVITWIGVGILLFFRARIKQNKYPRRFEHEIDFFAGDPLFYPGSFHAYRDTARVMRQRQPDAESEHPRHQMWQRFRSFMIWVFGLPIITVGAVALSILTGRLHGGALYG